jgi:hypothetical protein
MDPKSPVRVAGPDDYAEIWRLFTASHAENGQFSLAPQKVDYFIQRALWPERIHPMDTGQRGVIGVIGPSNALEALAFLTIGELWYTSDKHIGDCLVFVDPTHRDKPRGESAFHGKRLLEWMKEQSRLIGLPLMSGVASSVRTEAKCALYRRMFPKIGEVFLWRDGVTAAST